MDTSNNLDNIDEEMEVVNQDGDIISGTTLDQSPSQQAEPDAQQSRHDLSFEEKIDLADAQMAAMQSDAPLPKGTVGRDGIVRFTEQELSVIKEAARRGQLTEKQDQKTPKTNAPRYDLRSGHKSGQTKGGITKPSGSKAAHAAGKVASQAARAALPVGSNPITNAATTIISNETKKGVDKLLYGTHNQPSTTRLVVEELAATGVVAPAIAATDGLLAPVAPAGEEVIQTAIHHTVDAIEDAFAINQETPNIIPQDLELTIKRPDDPYAPVEKGLRSTGRDYTNERKRKFGDHSIHTTHVAEAFLDELAPISGPADYVRRGSYFIARYQQHFVWVDNSYCIQSNMKPYYMSGDTRTPVTVRAKVYATHNAPYVVGNTHMLEIRDGSALPTATLDPSELDPWMSGPLPDGRRIMSALQPQFNCANRFIIQEVSAELTRENEFYDNCMLYAKLYYWALAIDLFTAMGLAPTAVAFPADNCVTTINLGDNNLNANDWAAEFAKGSIQMLEGWDFTSADLQMIYWLAKPGHRLTTAEGVRSPNFCYVQWPKIDVCLLRHAAAAAMPAAALVSSAMLLAFIRRLANRRNEWDSAVKGLYIALDQIGVRYHIVNNHAYHLTSCWNAYHTYVPKPQDFNIFIRLWRKVKPLDSESQKEALAWEAGNVRVRANLAALYTYAQFTFTTTFLTRMSVTTRDLTNWGVGGDPRGNITAILADGVCDPGGTQNESLVYTAFRSAFHNFLGYVTVSNCYPGYTWQGSMGGNANAVLSFSAQTAALPPRADSVLAIDDFLLSRPVEWCVLGPETEVDLKADLRYLGTGAKRGVYTHKGDATYRKYANNGDQPYLFIPYGLQVVNAIHQAQVRPAGAAQYNACGWDYGTESDWDAPEADEAAVYNVELHIFEPCTRLTWDWQNVEVRAPCMNNDHFTTPQLDTLGTWRGKAIPRVGFVLQREAISEGQIIKPPGMSTMRSARVYKGIEAVGNDASGNPSKND